MAQDQDISERYELVERIAVGGMAEVFRAKKFGSHGFAKVMAVKRILPGLASNPAFVSRFIAEAKIAVTLDHANIVSVFDFSRFGESLYIAMEYVDGGDVAALLSGSRRRGAPLDVAAALHISIGLLEGLQFAHARGVVHRDISPSNILVSRAGEVKIADFGIAQAAGVKVTGEHRVVGKWPYMSPEQVSGGKVGAASDVFSAGACIYELVAGRRLFRGRDATAIGDAIASVARADLEPPSVVRPGLPSLLDAPILALLDRDPDRRRNADTALTELKAAAQAASIIVTASSLAAAVAELVPSKATDDTSSPALLDDVINSELEHARARAPGNARITLAATSHDVRLTAEQPNLGSLAFIKASAGADGLSEWVVGDATGSTYSIEKTARLFSVNDDDGADGGDERPRRVVPRERPAPPASRQTIIDATGGLGEAARSNPPMLTVAEEETRAPGRSPLPAIVGVLAVGALIGALVWGVRSRSGASSAPEDAGAAVATDASQRPVVLTVLSTPTGATVWLDGERLGVTPIESLPLEPRDDAADIELRLPGYRVASARVMLAAGSVARVNKQLELEVADARVDIQSEPWANIYFRGKKIGVAPVEGLSLPSGTHELTLVNPLEKRRMTLTVTVPAETPYKVVLPPP